MDELLAELGEKPLVTHGRLVLTRSPPRPLAWSLNTWFEPKYAAVESITQAAALLKGLQRNWALCPGEAHRRAALVSSKLPKVSAKPLKFPAAAPESPLGSWMLVDRDRMLYSARCSSPFPNGEAAFLEPEGNAPPSAAYLKLWEALAMARAWPQAGEHCLDLGSSPGSWTWALQRLGAKVTSVDKAALDPKIAALPGVEVLKKDAFKLDPGELPRVDWLFSDVICYPERLLELVQGWLERPRPPQMICTIKFQGPASPEILRKFAKIPGSHVRHLFHNKNEVTWIRVNA